MKLDHLKLSLSLAALALPCGLAHGQAALNGAGGVNMLGVGKISNTPTITLPTSLSGALSWEQGPALQGYVVPAGQLTGLTTAGTPVSYEDILPLKAIKLQVVTGAAGAAPTGVGTVIDSLGVDTNGVITDAFQLATGAAAGKVLVSDASGVATWQNAPAGSQTLSLSGTNLGISSGNSVNLAGINTDSQNLSLSGLNLGISGGTGVTLPAPTPSLSGSTLTIANGGSVNLAGINTDSQNLSLSGMTLGISGGTGITLPAPAPSVSGGNFVITTGGVVRSIPLSSFPNVYNTDGHTPEDRTIFCDDHVFSIADAHAFVVYGTQSMIGIGTRDPHSALHLPQTWVRRKITLYEVNNNANEFYGFGVGADGNLCSQIPSTANLWTFTAATSATTYTTAASISGAGKLILNGPGGVQFSVTPTGANAVVIAGGNTVRFTAAVTPDVNATGSLGNVNYRWANIYLSNAPNVSSDSRLKQDITTLGDNLGLQAVMKMRPVSYSLISDKEHAPQLGFIAQEMDKIVPDVVVKPQDDADRYSMKYEQLIPVLTKAIQDQQHEIAALKAGKDKLAAEVKELKAQSAEIVQLKTALEALHRLVAGKAVPATTRLVRN